MLLSYMYLTQKGRQAGSRRGELLLLLSVTAVTKILILGKGGLWNTYNQFAGLCDLLLEGPSRIYIDKAVKQGLRLSPGLSASIRVERTVC